MPPCELAEQTRPVQVVCAGSEAAVLHGQGRRRLTDVRAC